MDITSKDDTSTQSISDDQELAKALAGIAEEPIEAPTPVAPAPVIVTPTAPTTPVIAPVVEDEEPAAIPMPDPIVEPTPAPVAAPAGALDSIKQSALLELRPLIDKVELPAEEKFDTYLMLIRSTDDTSLIGPAHEAAQAITDEKRKAQALLDIIKEIDFLSHTTPQL